MADIVVDDALNYLTDESLSRKWTWFLNLDLSLDVTMIFQKKYQGWKLHVVFGGGTRDKMSILRRKEISLLRLENPALTTFVVKKYWLKKKCSKPLAHVMSKDLVGTSKNISIFIISIGDHPKINGQIAWIIFYHQEIFPTSAPCTAELFVWQPFSM